MLCDVNSSPFFVGRVIKKVNAPPQVKCRQLILRPMFKALSKFGRRNGKFCGAVGILSFLIGSEVCGLGRERNVSRAQKAVDQQRLRSAVSNNLVYKLKREGIAH